MISKGYEYAVLKSFLKGISGAFILSNASIFSMLGISLGVAVIITVMSVMNGFQVEVKERILNLLPHASITYAQASQDKETLPLVLKNSSNVKSFSVFIDREIIVIGKDQFSAVQLKAISPVDNGLPKKVSNLITEGDLHTLKKGEYNVVIGNGLANQLNVKIGDTITLMTQDNAFTPFGNLPRLKKFNITGIFQSGIFSFDQNLVLINILDAQIFLQLKNQIDGYDIEFNNPDIARYEIRNIALESNGGYLVSDWSKQNPNFFRSLELTKKIIFMVLLIILCVASFNIVSTLIMMIRQRRSTIGIIRTMGVNQSGIFRIFFSIGLTLGTLGSIIGIFLGVVITLNLTVLIQFIEKMFGVSLYQAEIYFLNEIPTRIDWLEVLMIFIVVLFLSVISSLLPSYRASKLNPAVLLKMDN
ncbi:MAG: lipoprotein-releasing ABC transporter permease subunit [Gammaproteobacteria bacterium]|nr:lipoprotein-releasing ABC transporter permease subunit [Gammaproteobacteria bacterium]